MVRRLVILYRELDELELSAIISNNRSSAKTKFLFSSEQFLPSEFQGPDSKAIKAPDHKIAENIRDCHDDVRKRGHANVGGKKLLERLSYKNQNFWFHIRGILIIKYRASIFFLKSIDSILEEIPLDEFDSIDVYHSDSFLKRLRMPQDKVNYHYACGASNSLDNGKSEKRKPVLSFALLFILRAFIGFIKFFRIFGGKKHMVIINPNDRQKILVPLRTELVEGDPYVEYLLMHTQHNSAFTYLTEVYPKQFESQNASSYLNRYLIFFKYFWKTINFETFLFLTLLNPLTYYNLYKLSRQLRDTNQIFREEYKNIDDDVFISCLASVNKLILYLYVRVRAAKLMFRILPVKSIGGMNEHGPSNQPILNGAESSGVTSFGIQHGAIVDYHALYKFSEEDMPYQPWPDQTIVYGSYWKNVLVETSTYPADKITILGQMRTDCIPTLLSQKDKLEVHELDKSRPVVLYASQPKVRGEEHVREMLIRDVLKLSKELNQVQFIIRPHPSDAMNLDYFYSIAKEVGTENFVISQTELYYDLAVSDIVMVYYSTVGVEAIYFDKHLVLLDYLESHFVEYMSDVGIRARDYKHLKEITEKVLAGELAIEPEVKKAFIDKMAFRIDGNSTKRYVEFIESLGGSQ
jgi:hypothetical protein